MKELLFSVEFWQNLQFVLVYPVLTVTGIGWAIGFYLHYQFSGASSDRWAGRVGLGISIFAILRMIGLALAKPGGFSVAPTAIFSISTIILSGVMVWGTGWLLHYYFTARKHIPRPDASHKTHKEIT